MEFEQHVQVELKANLKKSVGYLHRLSNDKKVARIHVICPCIKYAPYKQDIWFSIKPRSYSRKIVVITYTDDTQQFLEFNIVPNDVK